MQVEDSSHEVEKYESWPKDKDLYLSAINIKQVQHLSEIEIPISKTEKKHLIITGKNGSGKTSLLEVLKISLSRFEREFQDYEVKGKLTQIQNRIEHLDLMMQGFSTDFEKAKANKELYELEKEKYFLESFEKAKLSFANEEGYFYEPYKSGNFLLAHYPANRTFNPEKKSSLDIERPKLPKTYSISESFSDLFLKILTYQEVQQSFAQNDKLDFKIAEIKSFFDKIQKVFQDIFEDPTLTLKFDRESLSFSLDTSSRFQNDLYHLPDGYSAILSIITDLMVRAFRNNRVNWQTRGIVLIDEIEVHLHIQLQKRILKHLTSFFPNIQFIVTTHSPFVITSIDNAVVYDLEKQVRVEDHLTQYSSEAIVEGFFEMDKYSEIIKEKIFRYEELLESENRSDADNLELIKIEYYLEDIPTFFRAPELRMKLDSLFELRDKLNK